MIKENIDNLTSLWKTAAAPYDALYQNPVFSYCYLPQSQWPNRLWFHQRIDSATLELAITSIPTGIEDLTLPVFGEDVQAVLESQGFVKKFQQTGMSRVLDTPFPADYSLRYERITEQTDAVIWSDTFTKAFNYIIWDEILLRTQPAIQYYLVWRDEQPIGTAVLFITDNIAGIHSVGVIPEARRKGYALEIMHFILNEAISQGCRYTTLQASVMGKGLYEQLGFSNDFMISNYKITTDA